MVAAKKHVPIVKKKTTAFKRHQSDRFMRVGESWRKPKGIDNAMRRRFSGRAAMPKVCTPRGILGQEEDFGPGQGGRNECKAWDCGNIGYDGYDERINTLTVEFFCTDRLRQQQEDPPHDAFRPQGFPRQQRPRPRPPPHAQQDLRRRVSTTGIVSSSADRNADRFCYRIAHAVSARKRIEIVSRAKQLGVKVTNGKAKITTES